MADTVDHQFRGGRRAGRVEEPGPRSVDPPGRVVVADVVRALDQVTHVAARLLEHLLQLLEDVLALGLAAGLTYGLYSVFNKRLVRHNRPWVVQVYGLLIGALVLVMEEKK